MKMKLWVLPVLLTIPVLASAMPDTLYCADHVTCAYYSAQSCAYEGVKPGQAQSKPYFQVGNPSEYTVQEDYPFQYAQLKYDSVWCIYANPQSTSPAKINLMPVSGHTYSAVKNAAWSGDLCSSTNPLDCGIAVDAK